MLQLLLVEHWQSVDYIKMENIFFFFYQWLDVKSRWSFHGKSVWCLGVCQGTVMNVTHMPRNSEDGYEPEKDIWSELLS